MQRPSLFGSTEYLRSYTSSNRPEIDLRAEFDLLIYGDNTHIPHGKYSLIRNLRRDSDFKPIACVCFSTQNTTEPDPRCSYCLGEGYLWDENWTITFAMNTNADAGLARKYLHMPPGFERNLLL